MGHYILDIKIYQYWLVKKIDNRTIIVIQDFTVGIYSRIYQGQSKKSR